MTGRKPGMTSTGAGTGGDGLSTGAVVDGAGALRGVTSDVGLAPAQARDNISPAAAHPTGRRTINETPAGRMSQDGGPRTRPRFRRGRRACHGSPRA